MGDKPKSFPKKIKTQTVSNVTLIKFSIHIFAVANKGLDIKCCAYRGQFFSVKN